MAGPDRRSRRSCQEHIRLMCDLLVLAFQTDLTRVATFPFANEGSNRPYQMIDVPEGHHDLSHHGNDPKKLEKIKKINTFHIEQFAYLLGKLKAVKEANGTTLLDNSMIVYGSGIGDGNRHNHDDLPILLAGKGGGTIETGRHIVVPEADTPLTNLYLALFERMGAPAEVVRRQHGRAEDLIAANENESGRGVWPRPLCVSPARRYGFLNSVDFHLRCGRQSLPEVVISHLHHDAGHVLGHPHLGARSSPRSHRPCTCTTSS